MKPRPRERVAAFRYQAYGLVIEAKGLLPVLPPAQVGAPVDVRIEILGAEPWGAAPIPPEVWDAGPERDNCKFIEHPEFDLWVVDCADGRYHRFNCKDGNEDSWHLIINPKGTALFGFCRPENLGPPEAVATQIAKRWLGCVLRVRGVTCLHATVMIVAGRAIALLGKSGAGKSTTAAAMLDQGYSLLTDDVAALRDLGNTFLVEAGFPKLPLFRGTIEHFFPTTDTYRNIPHSTLPNEDEKRYLDVGLDGVPASHGQDWGFHTEPATLSAIYLLDEYVENGAEAVIEPVTGAEGLFKLAANTYVSYMLDHKCRERELERLGRLAAHVPIRRLGRPHGLENLAKIVDLMVADVRELKVT